MLVVSSQRRRGVVDSVGKRRTREFQSEPSAHFGWVESLSLWRGAHFFKVQSGPSALLGWVESLLPWPGAHFENAK